MMWFVRFYLDNGDATERAERADRLVGCALCEQPADELGEDLRGVRSGHCRRVDE